MVFRQSVECQIAIWWSCEDELLWLHKASHLGAATNRFKTNILSIQLTAKVNISLKCQHWHIQHIREDDTHGTLCNGVVNVRRAVVQYVKRKVWGTPDTGGWLPSRVIVCVWPSFFEWCWFYSRKTTSTGWLYSALIRLFALNYNPASLLSLYSLLVYFVHDFIRKKNNTWY